MNPIALALTFVLTASAIMLPNASAEDGPVTLPATQKAPEIPQKSLDPAIVKPTAPAQNRKPFLFINISKRPEYKDAVLAAWDAGLGRSSDIVSSAPGMDNRAEVANIKVGTHAWMHMKAGTLAAWARNADETDKNVGWLWYNIEEGSPPSERQHAIKSAQNLHAICAQHGWKFGIITDERAPRLMAYATHADALIFECQKDQNGPTVKKVRGLAANVRKVNPKCLFGIQLGVGVASRGYGGSKGALAFYKATQDFVDLYSVWWGKQTDMIELLQTLNSPPAPALPSKASTKKRRRR